MLFVWILATVRSALPFQCPCGEIGDIFPLGWVWGRIQEHLTRFASGLMLCLCVLRVSSQFVILSPFYVHDGRSL